MSTYVCNVGHQHDDYLLPPPDWNEGQQKPTLNADPNGVLLPPPDWSEGQQKPTLNVDPNGVLLPPPDWGTPRAALVAQPVANYAGAAGVPLPGMAPTVTAADVLLPPPDWSNR